MFQWLTLIATQPIPYQNGTAQVFRAVVNRQKFNIHDLDKKLALLDEELLKINEKTLPYEKARVDNDEIIKSLIPAQTKEKLQRMNSSLNGIIDESLLTEGEKGVMEELRLKGEEDKRIMRIAMEDVTVTEAVGADDSSEDPPLKSKDDKTKKPHEFKREDLAALNDEQFQRVFDDNGFVSQRLCPKPE